MQRYDNTEIVKDKNGKRYYKSILLPEINVSDADEYIIVTQQKRLDHLAQEYYSDATLWWVIALANNLSNPTLVIPLGMQIRIPKDINSYITNYRELNV
ncbi:MAG: hypothetical protein WC346_08140 [Methanogenium sp.]|jgi:nucleoid-associated protein YgaU